MTRRRGELPEPEEALLGIERPSLEQEAEQARVAQEQAQLRRHFMLDLMARPLFREWLMAKIMAFDAFGMPFGVGPTGFPDPQATFFKMGIKAAGWALWEEIDNLSPELASLMRREAALHDG